jgi:hypothetical protein
VGLKYTLKNKKRIKVTKISHWTRVHNGWKFLVEIQEFYQKNIYEENSWRSKMEGRLWSTSIVVYNRKNFHHFLIKKYT